MDLKHLFGAVLGPAIVGAFLFFSSRSHSLQQGSDERRRYIYRGPYHRYTDFQIVECYGVPDDVRKGLEEDLKDPNSDIRRDIRRLFEMEPPGEYTLSVWVPPYKYLGLPAGCVIKFRKIR